MPFEGFRWIAGARVVHGGGGVAATYGFPTVLATFKYPETLPAVPGN